MSIRRKIIISLCLIIAIIAALLTFNSIMTRKEAHYVKKLLWIHHQYTSLLNLKIHVTRQLSEAQDIFIYGKKADPDIFKKNAELVRNEGGKLTKALMEEDALPYKKMLNGSTQSAKHNKYTTDNQQRLLKMQHNYEDLQRQLVLMATLLNVGRKAKAQEHFRRVISQQFNDFFSEIDDWIAAKRQELDDTEANFIEVNQRNNYSANIALIIILIIVSIFAALLIYMFSVRIQELLRATKRIAGGDLNFTVTERGNDEFTQFAKAMNFMMAGLAASRTKLLEQSYYSGMADMVAGTLHNIRNSLSPVVVDLEMIGSKLIAIKTGRMQQAMQEIMDQNTSSQRWHDLLDFMSLTTVELNNSVPQILDDLAGVSKKLSVISTILDNNSQYSVSDRPLENILLVDIIQDAMGMVSKPYLEVVTVEIPDKIKQIEQFMTQRIVLVQIIANLLNNAIESILRSGREDGLVKIIAEESTNEKGRALQIEILDNGVGISTEMLHKIFQRGVSSKKTSSGLGLHWCANAASSLKGRLTAQSIGLDNGGASLYLILEI